MYLIILLPRLGMLSMNVESYPGLKLIHTCYKHSNISSSPLVLHIWLLSTTTLIELAQYYILLKFLEILK